VTNNIRWSAKSVGIERKEVPEMVTREEMAQEIGKSKATVQRCIKSLLEKGFIKRIGSNKTGYWVVV
jgi:predicted transcriptional regulator